MRSRSFIALGTGRHLFWGVYSAPISHPFASRKSATRCAGGRSRVVCHTVYHVPQRDAGAVQRKGRRVSGPAPRGRNGKPP